jgi:hypothetical protein
MNSEYKGTWQVGSSNNACDVWWKCLIRISVDAPAIATDILIEFTEFAQEHIGF